MFRNYDFFDFIDFDVFKFDFEMYDVDEWQ